MPNGQKKSGAPLHRFDILSPRKSHPFYRGKNVFLPYSELIEQKCGANIAWEQTKSAVLLPAIKTIF
jgi:hypothetical protein